MRVQLPSSLKILALALGLGLVANPAQAFDIPGLWLAHGARNNPNDPGSSNYIKPTPTPFILLPIFPCGCPPGCMYCAIPGSETQTASTVTPSMTASPSGASATPTQTPTQIPMATATPSATPAFRASASCESVPSSSALVSADNSFALSFFSNLVQSNGPTNNLVYSPYSVASALDLIWTGTQGSAATQMASTLGYQESSSSAASDYQTLNAALAQDAGSYVTLTTVNGLWLNNIYPFNTAYLNQVQNSYGADTNLMSFSSPNTVVSDVNSWADQNTQGLIPVILSNGDVTPQDFAVWANAIYFDGKWASQFNADLTQTKAFTRADGTTVEASMMDQTGEFAYGQSSGTQMVELPYVGGAYAMDLILPPAGTSTSALEADLNLATLNTWISGLCFGAGEISMPKLNLSYGVVSLIPNLKSIGMTDIFDCTADFSPMSTGITQGCVVVLKHKAVVIVNEQGTQAAAVTAGIGVPAIAFQPSYWFDADRPFLFLIRDLSTGDILFVGQVNDPTVN